MQAKESRLCGPVLLGALGGADRVGDFLNLRLRPVQHRNARATLGQRFSGCASEAGRSPTTTAFVPSIST